MVQFYFHRAVPDLFAQIPQEWLVFRMQHTRPAQGAAQLAAALEKRHPVSAFGGHASGLQAGGPGADHHHSLDPGGTRRGQFALLAGAGIDRTVHREALFHCVDAVFTRNALADPMRLTGPQFARQVGVGQQRASHGDEIGAPIGQDPFGSGRVVNTADDDHRHVDHLLDRRRGADIDLIAVVGGVDHPGDEPVDHAAADVERVDPGGDEFGCHPGGFVNRTPAGDAFVAGDAQRDGQRVADLGANRGQRVQHHPHPAARRVALIVVGTPIALRGKERAQQHVAVCGVQLDAVVAGLGGPPRRGLEQVEHFAELLLADLGGRTPGEVGRNHRGPQRRHTEDLRPEPVGTGVHDLGLDLRAVFVHDLHQCAMGIDRVVGGQVQTAGSLRVLIVDTGGAQRDQPDTALSAGGEVVPSAFRRQPVRGSVHRLHGRHDDPVAHRHGADPSRRQQVRKAVHSGLVALNGQRPCTG